MWLASAGNFTAGINEENGGTSIEDYFGVDQLFVVPQGLPHYMSNQDCSLAEYLQIFNVSACFTVITSLSSDAVTLELLH